MPKRSSSGPPAEKPASKQERRPRDPNALAFNVVREAVGDAEKFEPEEAGEEPARGRARPSRREERREGEGGEAFSQQAARNRTQGSSGSLG
jgi:hypothetical protein